MSVGGAYASANVYSVNHPQYTQFSDAVAERVQDIGIVRGLSKATATAVPLGVALLADELAVLVDEYPEFNVVNVGQSRPGHAYWVAYRRLANEWLTEQSDKLSGDVCHLGGSLASYLVRGAGASVKLLYDLTEPVVVHEKYSTTAEAHTVFSDYATVSRMMGRVVDHSVYDSYLKGTGLKVCTKVREVPQCSVLLADLSLYSYSPMQLASMMKMSGASVALGCFVYHPSMLLSREGEIGNTGVYYSKADGCVSLHYPEGAAGVTDYGKDVWASWLVNHSFALGTAAKASWFQVELLKNRGHLMFFRMTALGRRPESLRVSHALDMGQDSSYVVSCWRLASPTSDPGRRQSWVNEPFLADKRIVDRLYQFAMQLTREQFTRYALRKQAVFVSSRVTIRGTAVSVAKPLSGEQLDALVVAIYSRAFVDRYEAGVLTSEAMSAVKRVSAFQSASSLRKMGFITMSCLNTAFDYTFGAIDQVMRKAADAVRDAVSYDVPRMEVEITDLPPYLLLSEASRAYDLPGDAGALAAAESTRAAARDAVGYGAVWARAFSRLADTGQDSSIHSRYRVDEVNLADCVKAVGPSVDAAIRAAGVEVGFDEAPYSRQQIDATMVVRQVNAALRVDYDPVADPVEVFNRAHSAAFPGVAEQELEQDVASITYDPQDRFLVAAELRMPRHAGDGPAPREYYRSKVRALNVPKRQQTLQELLSALAARNMNAPQVSLPQDEDVKVHEVWNYFLDNVCAEGAREKLAKYQADPVALGEDAFREWATQSGPDKLNLVRRELEELGVALDTVTVSDFLAMIKTDVKPPLSTKPLEARTESQVIAYHAKALSALFSSMFRVIARRFLSLLKPQYHLNLLKDKTDIRNFLRTVHPYGQAGLKYLENDFSKYDKSQGRFVHLLEWMMYRELGFNEEMLAVWAGGHVKSSLRSLTMGVSLVTWFQRKSGDATTAFANGAVNIVSVCYAYRLSNVEWAVFMGDDSLVCVRALTLDSGAVQVLEEVFNLGAKMYVSDFPYFASNFVFVDDANCDVVLVADPIKRIERWSMHVSAADPQWHERYVSARDSVGEYLNCANLAGLSSALYARYGISADVAQGLGPAVATVIDNEKAFRAMWEEHPEVSLY